jgi:hypothetical protein
MSARTESGPAPIRLPRARPLNYSERARLVIEIVGTYARARRTLQRVPIASVVQTLRAESPPETKRTPGNASMSTLEEARRLGRAVSRTLALLPGDTRCLARSLVLTRLLARRGIPAKLVIGTRSAPDFLAHAWVEHEGQPVISAGDGSFGRLVEL